MTKASTDKTFKSGDLIWLSENKWIKDGTNDFKCEVSNTHYLDIANEKEYVRAYR